MNFNRKMVDFQVLTMSSIVSEIKRYLYNWSRPEMNENGSQDNNKGTSTEVVMNVYEKYFVKLTETSWKGEKQTLECLEKIMKNVEKYVYQVVKGYVQSGKSQLMIYYATWIATQHNMNVVIMLRNQTADIKSLANKFRNFKTEKNIKNIEIIKFANYYNVIDFEDLVDKFRESGKIFIILGNSEQLSKMNEIIAEGNVNPFAMCIDELDLNEKDSSTSFQREFEKMKSSGMISHCLGVTGTALPVIFKKISTLTNKQIISLDAPLNYRGIHNITFTEIDIENVDIVKNTMLNMLKSKYAFFDKENKKHPAILLIKDERVKANQIEMQNEILKDKKISKNWATIVYNGDGVFVSYPNGEINNLKNKSINYALQKIKNEFSENIRYIAIISGDMANRGLSFVSEDYNWHLTHMIMCARESSSGTNLTQYARLCGCYNDDIPLEMFTSNEIARELFAYDILQEKCLDQCEDLTMDTESLKTRLEKMKLTPDAMVRRPIDFRVKLKYNSISNYDKIMCGMKVEAKNIQEAVEKLTLEEKEIPVLMIKETVSNKEFNKENCDIIKNKIKEAGVKNGIRIIQELKNSLHKNPKFVTKDRENYKFMIGNKNGKIAVYQKLVQPSKMKYNQLYIFETPNGIYSARNLDKEDLEEIFQSFSLKL